MPVELLGRTILLAFFAIWGFVIQIILRERNERRDALKQCGRVSG